MLLYRNLSDQKLKSPKKRGKWMPCLCLCFFISVCHPDHSSAEEYTYINRAVNAAEHMTPPSDTPAESFTSGSSLTAGQEQPAGQDVHKAVSIRFPLEDIEGFTSGGISRGQEVADFAVQFVGGPYVWGGTSLTGGADCSGFVLSVYANFGISLPHYAASQAAYGDAVPADPSVLQPGDLVFYSNGWEISHVAIYIGNGQIVHAQNSQYGITVSSMYYQPVYCCRRLLY